ncbi:MAG: TlpA disulfide reductase family protein [Arachidicoccus sp.]|nr:TlpA disulfide reductase family protein [Arachidicoccus sp.]
MKKKFIIYLLLLMPVMVIGQNLSTEKSAFKMGDTVPVNITFGNIHNLPQDILSFGTLRGKLVILDFWTTGCHSCFGAFPHLEELQNEFKDSLQIILVNPWESKERVEQWISKRKESHTGPAISTLPVIYGDSTWRIRFPHKTVPHHVWIDESGRVISYTNGYNTTRENIMNWLKKRKLELTPKIDIAVSGYEPREKGLVVPGNGIKPLFYTAFERANFGFGQSFNMKPDTVNHLYSWRMLNLPIVEMFKNAFHLRPFDYRVLLKTRYAEKMSWPDDPNLVDDWRKGYCFSYQITLTERLKDSIHSYVQNDLNRYLSAEMGISAAIQSIRYPAYVLSKQPSFALREEPEQSDSIEIQKVFAYYRHHQWQEISFMLKEKLENFKDSIIFEDETGLKETARYSITLPEDMNDISALIACLKKQGLQLRKTERVIPVLVIKDNQ